MSNTSTPQFLNWWENRRSKNNKMFRGMWEEKKKERKKKEEKKRKKPNKERTIKVNRIAEKWEIWDKEKLVKLENEAKKLVLPRFHKWIYIFGKKASERIPIRKIWYHIINMKEGFVLRKEKMYLLSREERKEVHEFIDKQLRTKYIRPLNSFQTTLVFFIGKKNSKNRIV